MSPHCDGDKVGATTRTAGPSAIICPTARDCHLVHARPGQGQGHERACVCARLWKKGEGKSANYGTAIPPPTLVDPSDLPEAIRPVSSVLVKEDPCKDDDTPPPIPATTEDVEMWMETGFRKLTNMSTKSPPEVGESVLWRGVKTGKHGQPSTKCEWFNGKVRYVQVEDNEVFLYID